MTLTLCPCAPTPVAECTLAGRSGSCPISSLLRLGGVFGFQIQLLEDLNGTMNRLYDGDKLRAGHSFRTYYFIVDPGQVRIMTYVNAADDDDGADDSLHDEADDF